MKAHSYLSFLMCRLRCAFYFFYHRSVKVQFSLSLEFPRSLVPDFLVNQNLKQIKV